jgi:hypothetical protein
MPLIVALMALGLASPPARPPRIGDAGLLRFARSRFDPYKRTGRIAVLGVHRGTLVVVDYPCGDVCPAYTRRIVHYDVPPEACGRVGGTIVNELIPRGPAVMPRPYCEPTVIVGVKPRPSSPYRSRSGI